MNDNPCLDCGLYDHEFGCTCASMDKWYACPLEPEPDWDEIFKEHDENQHNLKESDK